MNARSRYRRSLQPTGRTLTVRFYLMTLLLALCALGGGSARVDVWSLLYVRPAAAVILAAVLLLPGRIDLRSIRMPLLLLLAFALTMAIQLVPLPPAIWTHLPGHRRFVAAASIAGFGQPWRPISLTPTLTINSILALMVGAAGLVGMATLGRRERTIFVWAVLGCAVVTALVGTIQIAAGGGPAYLYSVTSVGLPVGLFANRNHQAVFLAACLPLLAVSAGGSSSRTAARPEITVLAAGIGFLFLVMLLVTGSRAGIGFGLVGLVCAFALAPKLRVRAGRRRTLVRMATWLVPVAALLLTLAFGRALSVSRLFALTGSDAEQRVQALPALLHMIRQFAPFGTGFGSFDPVFRVFEPDGALHDHYFNHAHDDWLELLLTGGIAATIVAVAFVAWLIREAIGLARDVGTGGREATLGLAGAAMAGILIGASLFDYPLRTPLLTLVFAIAIGWICAARREHATAEE